MKFVLLTFTLFLLFSANNLYAQCCGAGNPLGGFGDITEIPTKTLILSPVYKYSYSDQYYTGSDKSDIAPDEMLYNFASIDFLYGISYRLSVQGQVGYFFNKKKIYNNDWKPLQGFGLGDAALSVKYILLNNVSKKFSVSAQLGSKLPIGVFDQEVENVKLPISLQPSSGSFKYNASVIANKSFEKFIFSFRTMVEIATRIESKNFDYKYGNLFLVSFYSAYKLSNKFSIMTQLRYEYRSKSIRENNQIVESTGGQVLFLVPQLTYFMTPKIRLSIFPDIPIYKNINGTQITNKFAISFKLSKSFDLSSCSTSTGNKK